MADTVVFPIDTPAGRRTAEVSYERLGGGEPLVLLHGIGHHLQAWDPVAGILAAERDVIAVDLPGFGASPALPDGVSYDLRGVVPVLRGLFEALDLDRPHVAGNSLGGLLALQLAHEKLVRTAVALSPAGFWTEAERRYAFAVLRAMRRGAESLSPQAVARLARTAAGRAALAGTIYARPGRRSPDAVMAETRALRECAGFDATLAGGRRVLFTHDIADVPVTVAWGTRDRLLLRRQGVRAKQVIPGARLIRLPGCGHVPMNDDPALVARVILDATR
ncbi:alpha/beta fold hydrolase [Streptomyces sp. NRRL B-1677]|uniref:alpha/beta fold hydrolase n=1 Tax=Streptomyces TaxID=1883 RepID=UPI001892A7B0|nr:alpha/beta fold hydrolase [Streptomyces sp. NRRL B-1677]MBF6049778.1 alpha/beta fold hydrolase [Streptomyces sp. NRRL B-1677]